MRQTEEVEKIETTEEEVVYCDECADECTDSFEMVPRELCPDCQPSSFMDISDYREKFESFEDVGNIESISLFLFMVAIFPLSLIMSFFDLLDGDQYPKTFFIGVIGMLLWGGGITALVIML